MFTSHFVSVPTCGASRYSLLTGKLPRSRGDLSNEAIRNNLGGKPETDIPESFIQYLRQNGYYTIGIGRVQIMELSHTSGLRNLPALFSGTNQKLTRPESNQILTGILLYYLKNQLHNPMEEI